MGATRWQTFWHVTLPSLLGALLGGALLTFRARRRRIWLDDLSVRKSREPYADAPALYFREVQRRAVEAANAIAIVLAIIIIRNLRILFFGAIGWRRIDRDRGS